MSRQIRQSFVLYGKLLLIDVMDKPVITDINSKEAAEVLMY